MLNLLLSILTIAMASVMGFTLITQIELQNAAQDMRENERRLDAAADALTSRLGRLPNIDRLLAPEPNTSSAWATLPASISGVNSTVGGIPFLYCPLGYEYNDKYAFGQTSLTVKTGSTLWSNYTVWTRGGYVTDSNLKIDSELRWKRPVAILVAAGRKGSTPPRCEKVKMVNGRPVVEGGLARVIFDHRDANLYRGVSDPHNYHYDYNNYPAEYMYSNLGQSTGAEFYVANNGSGDGLSIDSPTSLDAALSHFMTYKPVSMSIKIIGSVSIQSGYYSNWWFFIQYYSKDSTSRLKISGVLSEGAPLPKIITSDASVPWEIPADTSIENVAFSNMLFIVGNGDRLRLSGKFENGAQGVQIGFPAVDQNMIEVLEGGQLKISQADMQVIGRNKRVIFNRGSVSIESSIITSWSIFGAWLDLGPNSMLSMNYSEFKGMSPDNAAIFDQGAHIVTGANVQIKGPWGGGCWRRFSDSNLAFKYTPGNISRVRLESTVTPPGAGATAAEIATYNQQFAERRKARLINSSTYQCSY